MIEIRMPRLSDTMEEGTITSWAAEVGSQVTAGQVLLEVETDKAVMEQEAFESGTFTHVLVPAGSTARIGEVIAVLDGPEDLEHPERPVGTASPTSTVTRTAPAAPAAGAPGPAPAEPRTSSSTTAAPASPLVRRLAREHGVDLAHVTGTGPGGRVVRRDLESYLRRAADAGAQTQPDRSGPATHPAPADRHTADQGTGHLAAAGSGTADLRGSVEHPVAPARRVTAERLTTSTSTVPQFSVTATADVTELVRLRRRLCDDLRDGDRATVSLNDLVVRASALALRAHPEVNASYVDRPGGPVLQLHARVNVGVAVATEHGLVVPVVHDADRLAVSGVHETVARLAAAAHERHLTVEQMHGGTFTVSNLGMLGVEHFRAIVNPPEAAILAVGAVRREAAVLDGEVTVRDAMTLTVSVDHRAVDGAGAARFLQTLVRLLERPWAVVA